MEVEVLQRDLSALHRTTELLAPTTFDGLDVEAVVLELESSCMSQQESRVRFHWTVWEDSDVEYGVEYDVPGHLLKKERARELNVEMQ